MFYKTENSNSVKPLEIEKDVHCYFVRKDFVLIPEQKNDNETRPEHWEYLEDKIPEDQWTTYITAKGAMDYVEAMEEANV